jgi:serine/threonine protein kinase
MDSRYAMVRELGSGAFGKVILAIDSRTGEEVAIKKLVSGCTCLIAAI